MKSVHSDIEEIIVSFFGAVKYDDDLTEGSPFQGMWVYDEGKSAFPQETLDKWTAQLETLFKTQHNKIVEDFITWVGANASVQRRYGTIAITGNVLKGFEE